MKLTKEQFLARCANAYDAGLIRPETIRLLDRWLDFVMRFEGGQMAYAVDFLDQEQRRHGFRSTHTLANDTDGYDLIRLSAIFCHSCQACATDPKAWWTRGAMCPHKPVAPSAPPPAGKERT